MSSTAATCPCGRLREICPGRHPRPAPGRCNAVLSILGGTAIHVALTTAGLGVVGRSPSVLRSGGPAGGYLDQAELVGVNTLLVDSVVRRVEQRPVDDAGVAEQLIGDVL